MKKIMSCILALVFLNLHAQQDKPVHIDLRTMGVKINVTNMDKAIDFYSTKLGFEVVDKANFPNLIILNSNNETEGNIYLNLVANLPPEAGKEVKATLSLTVNNLDSTIDKLSQKGIFVSKNKSREGVGNSIGLVDPFGTTLHLMEITITKQVYFKEPKMYNYGILVSNMDTARACFSKLGFTERSIKYLPLDMPLANNDKSFAFMLHYRDGIENIAYNSSNDMHTALLFKTSNIEQALAYLKETGFQLAQSTIKKNSLGRWFSFRDKFGLVYDVVEGN